LENDDDDDDDSSSTTTTVNDAHAKYYSTADRLAAVSVIQRWSHFQIIHTKGTINSLGYRSTNCVTQTDICMT
jgi:hypothetical protein